MEKTAEEYRGPSGFSIVGSEEGGEGASIPADSAVCDKCLAEIMGDGRRAGYAFTTCTDCGPRFTLLRKVPYDRENTSMDTFPMCPACGREFRDPSDRRFHHQTVCCPVCGPSYYLLDDRGRNMEYDDPFETLAGILDDGKIGVVKGWGGMHICCTLDRIDYMREWYGRKKKPFAIIARDMNAVRRYAEPTEDEERMLTSPQRPITLIKKRESELTEAASPGLDNIGMFLPYTGMHHLLFKHLKHDALVMTSANLPGEPMIVEDGDALQLGADAYLLHNQPIINRADDSVVRMFDGRTQFIRRSRGNMPYHLDVPFEGDVVALGAQENLTGSVASRGRIWPTQYIGNGEKIGVPEYLEEAVRTQMDLVGCTPQIITQDMHPGYANRPLARRMAEEFGAERMDIQHHWAHAASLMVDNRIDGCTALTVDGTGHGDDGTAWGGEVLSADFDTYRRTAHLECIPLLGGQKALIDLRRLKFAFDSMNGTENHDFKDSEAAVMEKLMRTSVKTSSFGRVLDALAYTLGLCKERTYDGEPAMRLEALLDRGKLIEGFETETVNGVIGTADLFARIDGKQKPADVAYSVVYNIVEEMVADAVSAADSDGFQYIGLTGGVSYNGAIARMFRDTVISSDHIATFHRDVPNGDGGISVGQAAIALRRIA